MNTMKLLAGHVYSFSRPAYCSLATDKILSMVTPALDPNDHMSYEKENRYGVSEGGLVYAVTC